MLHRCGHCKRLAPTWETLAKEYEDNSDAEVVSVDCTKQKKICDGAKVGVVARRAEVDSDDARLRRLVFTFDGSGRHMWDVLTILDFHNFLASADPRIPQPQNLL